MIRNVLLAGAGASLLVLAGAAHAATLVVTSYDGPNGDGQALGGSYNYWDGSYDGAGSTSTDGAPLSGGTGDLTDGVIAGGSWSAVENGAGTGPYVGWYAPTGVKNPLITFNFADEVVLTGLRIHLDNSGNGGVFAPVEIRVNGVAHSFTPPAAGSIGWVDLVGIDDIGTSHSVQFIQTDGGWAFVSEVEFSGRVNAVPEPASWAMMIGGLGLAGAALRRRRTVAALA